MLTSNSSRRHSTGPHRRLPGPAATHPRTIFSPSSKACDYAALCGESTALTSGGTAANLEHRHNRTIGIIDERSTGHLHNRGGGVVDGAAVGGGAATEHAARHDQSGEIV